MEETPQSRNTGRKGFVRSQTPADFHQRQVRLLDDQREQPIFVRLDRARAAIAAGWFGLPATRFLEALDPTDSAADAHFERRARAAARSTSVHRANHSLS
jgi:hypothetical protein